MFRRLLDIFTMFFGPFCCLGCDKFKTRLIMRISVQAISIIKSYIYIYIYTYWYKTEMRRAKFSRATTFNISCNLRKI